MKRSSHNLSHHHLTTGDMGYLYPAACIEVLPGDTFIGACSMLMRIAPLATPVMHPVDIRMHYWYVPNRLIWSQWEDFITGDDTIAIPTVTPANQAQTLILDRMGHPPRIGEATNALPVYAYNLIYNTRYRDQDVQTEVTQGNLALHRIAWEKDYFTTCRPAGIAGDSIDIPFSFTGTDLEVQGIFRNNGGPAATSAYRDDGTLFTPGGQSRFGNAMVQTDATNAGTEWTQPFISGSDLSAAGGIDINDFRRTMAFQRFAEARARYGSRYIDYLRYCGVNPSDGRLDLPEYLGGGRGTINFSEVLATAEGANTTVGEMFGHGISGMRTRRWRKMFEEHGFMIALLSVRPKAMYSNAIPRHFLRKDPMDYFQKELQVMPWQAVTEKEIYAPGSESTVFGYAPRYDEYRRHMSYVSGEFRETTFDSWHMSRNFTSAPGLNNAFISCEPTDRIYQDTVQPEFVATMNHNIRARRMVNARAAL